MSHYIGAMPCSPIFHYVSSGLLYSAQVFHLRATLSSKFSYRPDPIRSFQQQNNYVKRQAQLGHLLMAARYSQIPSFHRLVYCKNIPHLFKCSRQSCLYMMPSFWVTVFFAISYAFNCVLGQGTAYNVPPMAYQGCGMLYNTLLITVARNGTDNGPQVCQDLCIANSRDFALLRDTYCYCSLPAADIRFVDTVGVVDSNCNYICGETPPAGSPPANCGGNTGNQLLYSVYGTRAVPVGLFAGTTTSTTSTSFSSSSSSTSFSNVTASSTSLTSSSSTSSSTDSTSSTSLTSSPSTSSSTDSTSSSSSSSASTTTTSPSSSSTSITSSSSDISTSSTTSTSSSTFSSTSYSSSTQTSSSIFDISLLYFFHVNIGSIADFIFHNIHLLVLINWNYFNILLHTATASLSTSTSATTPLTSNTISGTSSTSGSSTSLATTSPHHLLFDKSVLDSQCFDEYPSHQSHQHPKCNWNDFSIWPNWHLVFLNIVINRKPIYNKLSCSPWAPFSSHCLDAVYLYEYHTPLFKTRSCTLAHPDSTTDRRRGNNTSQQSTRFCHHGISLSSVFVYSESATSSSHILQ
ncbi:uncharacterized protein CLUP02_08793 [Colletotrichum lupini]|uniref:WSC domain-containing protein n=1 Tax=Colletotrichum lupini TaxID=145971 RepID=A0A9Q8STK1_9PEZI|nr:uncharacterized protein CLUP02_08793 [Colletotrichum lupini]UQC83299.1 hypothetical protein CLUP02_08793 [Colletotrichum lupini]